MYRTCLCALLLALAGCRESVSPPIEAPPAVFEDRTAGSGLDFIYRNGEEAGHLAILESLGGGVALIDYDGDGLLDVFLTGGGYFDLSDAEFQKDKSKVPPIKGYPWKLFKNLGNFQFKDVTREVGLDQLGDDRGFFYSHGVAVCDYDRDGYPDILVTGWHRMALLHNEDDGRGGRRFVDVTRKAGLPEGLWTTSAAWADLDGDGWPDLYVCQYVNWSFEKNHPIDCNYGRGRDVCPPKTFDALPHRLFRNNGNRTFSDVSKEAGLRKDGKGLGVLIVDVDGDGKPDIYVGNDTTDNFLYVNRSSGPGKGDRISKITGPVPFSGPPGKIALEEKALASRVAVTDLGQATGSMGLDAAAYDGSDRPSLLVTTYEGELHSLFRNEGKGHFLYSTPISGLGALGRSYVGFGVGFLDYDNDGWEDIAIANGHVIHTSSAGQPQTPVLLRNDGKNRFSIVTAQAGSYFQAKHAGRGLAVGDLDNDGRPDLVFSSINEPATVLRNICDTEIGRAHV